MPVPVYQIIGLTALILTVLSTALQYLAFFWPAWWVYTNEGSRHVTLAMTGMFNSKECTGKSCDTKPFFNIEGELEWLFISRIFEAFACILCVIALLVHIIYLPLKREGLRSSTIYMLGAAGLFGLAGSFVFAAMNSSLTNRLSDEGVTSFTFAYPVGIVAGFLHIIASIITAVATIKGIRERHVYDDNLIV